MREAMHDVWDYLVAINADAPPPAEARRRLEPLAARRPTLAFDLVAQHEAFAGRYHYDLFVRDALGTTLAASLCPAYQAPWVMRGAISWRESEVVRVDGTALDMVDAMTNLDFLWNDARLVRRIVDAAIVKHELERDPVVPSEDEIGSSLNAFRRAHGLYTQEQTQSWLDGRKMPAGALLHLATELAKLTKLRARVTEGKEEGYFEAHPALFDVARIARVVLATETEAREIKKAADQTGDFFRTAEQAFDARSGIDIAASGFATLRRRDVAGQEKEALFAAPRGAVLGPFRDAGGRYEVVRVVGVSPAAWDAETQEAVRAHLFELWLDDRRRAAHVEWNWGTMAHTDAASEP